MFLTLENREVTRAYEDWSFSSSSENGLKDVRLGTSSTLLLLRDRDDAALPRLGLGETRLSIAADERVGRGVS